MDKHYEVLIIGGGTAGIMTAANLLRADRNIKVGIIEPADTHYYQAAWTLVGAGTYDYQKTARPMASVIPKRATWIKDSATGFDPENNLVKTASSGDLTYDYLVVAPGLTYDMDLVPGLAEVLDKDVVCSNYTDPEHTWKLIKNFEGGTALFTQPTTPLKCGGAPQKIMYLAESHWRKSHVRGASQVIFATPGTIIFGIPQIAQTLMNVVGRKDINLRFGYKLVKVDGPNRIAWYEFADHEKEYNHKEVKTEKDGKLTGIHYDFMHTAPPSVAPEFIRKSVLANEAGWLEVHKHSLQHLRYANIFGLGDVAALPTAKTGAAVRKQVPVVVENLQLMRSRNRIGSNAYNGYSSCPIVTDYGKMVLAEFDYDNNFTPDPKLKQLLISDSAKEHWRLWMLKKYGLPYLYWNKMLKGKDV
ncbi:sulfide:quinone oxidoreductase [Robiginitalea myxolifaciens]|uniref:Sulfide:quinone oxidoreductase n=1 Tax=Robiginitalea myxolifaciens TaxID=400055 RepID=A0A1I6G4E2_9FLAO|nr:FAD/NAD(P)-binding oxidoreductase [Robiginitalea myxolifaciens]SFR36980.1 sulfide:quinone oxidoreductase [Robiginitalea myxolifaciens]